MFCAAIEPLLDGANPVPDSYLTASSEALPDYAASNAGRLRLGHWGPTEVNRNNIPPTVFLQVYQICNTIIIVFTIVSFVEELCLTCYVRLLLQENINT